MPHIDERRYPHVAAAVALGDTTMIRVYARRGAQAVSRKWQEKRNARLAEAIARGDEKLASKLRQQQARLARQQAARLEAEAWEEHDADRAAVERKQRIDDWRAANYNIIPPPSACGD